jgi:AcrR family transcriptional regulator
MPRAALQPDEIATFRQRASEAATKLFAAHGYEAVTMRALAERLGVSAMTPYRYLAGKDELVALVRTSAFRQFGDALEAATARVADPEERLRLLKRAYLRFATTHDDAYRIMFELRGADDAKRWPELAREAARAFGVLYDAVAAAIAAGVLDGDPLTIAHLLWAGAHGLASLHLAGRLGQGRSLDRLAAIDHELAGFRAPRAPTKPRATRRRNRPAS